MKKLLLGASLVIGAIFSSTAQTTIYSTNFPTAAIPTGWSQQVAASDPTNGGWQVDNVVLPTTGYLAEDYMPASGDGDFAFVNDIDNNTTGVGNTDTLYTGVMDCSAYTSVFISFDIWFQGYYDGSGSETASVAYSIDGGATWATAILNPYGSWTTLAYDISSFVAGQSNVKIAFTYSDGGTGLVGMGLDNVNIYSPASFDVGVVAQNLPFLMQVGKNYNFSGVANDSGSTTITSMTMNYSVNGNTPVSQAITGISGFSALTSYTWSMNSTNSIFSPSAPGPYTVKYWANNLNGSSPNVNTDTLVAHFLAVDSVQPKQVMFEEFSCASCDPCMYAMPNIDSVAQNTVSYCNTIRYHWYYPGQDMINQVTSAIVNGRMNTYYGQYGVPDAQIDGASYYPGYGYLSSGTIQQEAAVGSPFKIDVTSATYTASSQTFDLNATIKSYGTFPAGLVAQVYLTEDSIDFKTDQSVEDPQNTVGSTPGFQPPIGNDASGNSDYYYPFVLNFPDAVEDALPSISGTSLSAFTSGTTQTVSVSWAKNHAWANNYATYPYDSAKGVHMTIFIQDNSGNAAAGVPAQYIYQSKRVPIAIATGLQEISNGVYFNMYPNPTNSNTTLAFKLDKDQNVSIQVFNMLGEQVYSDNEGMMSSGQHTVIINGSTMQSGVYFVRFNTDNTTTTQKLVIQR